MPYLFFFILNLVVFYPIFKGLVPLPTDAMAGVYYPWAAKFWGYVAGIPYKNMALTDVFSQLYPWRALAMDTIRSGEWPLWNNLSFSGYPLLANWQSAPLYPLNLLMLAFGNLSGYTLMVFLQPLLSMSFMYLFLREIKITKISATFGAVVFAFSGFFMTYLQYATTGQILMWVPLALFLIEKYFSTKFYKYLFFLSLTIFPILTGGFFQPAFYALLIISLYSVFISSNKKDFFVVSAFLALGCLTAAAQMLPTAELLSRSIRLVDHNISEYQNGILPLKNLVTLLAPDYFGNPTTNNFWGFMQYQETSGYFSLITLILCLVGLLSKSHTWRSKLFYSLFFGSLILAFDNPISQAIYAYKVPLISTGYASRWLMITSTSAAILAAIALDQLKNKKYLIVSFLVMVATAYLFWQSKNINPVSFRNLILPTAISVAAFLSSIFAKNKKIFGLLLLLLVTFDLLRYTIKFTPFSRREYSQSSNSSFDFIKKDLGLSRVAAESGPVMPANTWMYASIPSVSGYDPLAPKDYATYFSALNSDNADRNFEAKKITSGTYTRYLNINNFRSPLLSLAGNKYAIALKTKDFRITPEGKYDQGAFPPSQYKLVFTDGPVVILENTKVLARLKLYYQATASASLENALDQLQYGQDFNKEIIMQGDSPKQYTESKTDTLALTSYTPNKVDIITNTGSGAYLFLSDTNYHGWEVLVNDTPQKIHTAFGVYRAVEVPAGESAVTFRYRPKSFQIGFTISLASFLIIFIGYHVTSKQNKRESN